MEKKPLSFLKKMPIDQLDEGVDLQRKDGDPRKTAYIVSILRQSPNIIKEWQKIGLMKPILVANEKVEKDMVDGHSVKLRGTKEDLHYERRKHMAPEHMVTVTLGVIALGDLLVGKGIIENGDQGILAEAALSHDLNKQNEYWYAKLAQECSSLNEMKEKVEGQGLSISDDQLNKIWSKETKGERGLAAYDVAGDGVEDILRKAGVSESAIIIQNMVAHHSCPDIEILLEQDSFSRLDILKLVMHYLDDIVVNPNQIDPTITTSDRMRKNVLSRRMDQNRNNPGYFDYNEAWRKYSDRNETAFDMQERVGKMVEQKLAELLNIDDPLTLPSLINQRIERNILDFTSKKNR